MSVMNEEAVKELNRLRAENEYLREKLADRESTITLLKAREWVRDADEVHAGCYTYHVPLA